MSDNQNIVAGPGGGGSGGPLVKTPTERLSDALTDLVTASQAVNEAALGTLNELPWEIAARMLKLLRAITTDHLGPVEASLVRHLYLVAPHGDTELDGVGVIGVRRSVDRKEWSHWSWQHDVRGAIVETRLAGHTELYDLDGNAYNVLELLDAVQSVHGAQAPKVTALRSLKLDPAAYCEQRPGRPQVDIR